MKYFTPELFVKLQAGEDGAMEAADLAWENASDRYSRRLRKIKAALPPPIRDFIEGYYLHDAEVLRIARLDDSFILEIRPESPPQELLFLIYSLVQPPTIEHDVLPGEYCSQAVRWLYDELDVIRGGQGFSHEILLSNGWQVRIRFRDMQLLAANDLMAEATSQTIARTA